jgi:hypothetical protein
VRRGTVVLLVLAAAVFAGVSRAAAGWIIDQVVKEAGATGRQQIILQADRMKTAILDPGGHPRIAVIVDLDAQTITQVDYLERHYVTATVFEHIEMMRTAQRAAVAQMAEAMKAMKERTRDMPPLERNAVDEMLRAQMRLNGALPPECPTPRREIRKTAQRGTIAAYAAIRYDVLSDGKPDSEVWIAPDITAWQELDLRKLERFSTEMAKLSGCVGGRSSPRLRGLDPSVKLAGEGFSVRTVDRASGAIQEVVKAERRTVAPAEFEPPLGFERQALAPPR